MPSNNEFSNIDIAELTLVSAIAKTSQLTGLNQQEALVLLTTQAKLKKQSLLTSRSALISSDESQFIANLFH